MKIIHTADLHLGQVIYQNYDRVDEHDHFFGQLVNICTEEKPDALVVSGDIFDIQQPSAATKKAFTDHFVNLHNQCPSMRIVITAGNHDSASRIQADSAVWKLANARLVGVAPATDLHKGPDGWQDDFVVKMESGYIVAVPYMIGEHKDTLQSILNWIEKDNIDGKPVVMMGHLAVTGLDATGHDFEIGKIKTQSTDSLGHGYDYLALGHIHKPQTIDHQQDCMEDDVTYPSGVIRYSGSALHVSCDEKYPHTVSIVEIDRRGGNVHIRQHRIDELRHFFELPQDGSSFSSAKDAIDAIKAFASQYGKGYFRIRLDYNADIPANFNNEIYEILKVYGEEIRFNPKHIWVGAPEKKEGEKEEITFEVAELQQMTDPMTFIEKTKSQYPNLDLDQVRKDFEEVKKEMILMEEEEKAKTAKKTKVKGEKAAADNEDEETEN